MSRVEILCFVHAGVQCVCMTLYPATYLIRTIYGYWQVNFNISYRNGFNVFFCGFIVVYCTKRILQGVVCNNMNSAYISLSVNLIYWLLRQSRVRNLWKITYLVLFNIHFKYIITNIKYWLLQAHTSYIPWTLQPIAS